MPAAILTYGIPQFVLPNSVVDREIETLKARGVEIVTGTPIDKDKSVDDLLPRAMRPSLWAMAPMCPSRPEGWTPASPGCGLPTITSPR